ncbi:ATP-dependent RNA helicase HelY [Candidatus Planktophila versatilis]|uniref:ATP-dependent RNA helicase HelY n=1 Tax=Candidatus Planktophila versatilis TaxID=1884905 RepID=A0AAC9YVK8_9ACTN|nr:DEAD/DEAH box helicase [Candidatus Planktophila versatilis]ASY22573.1 ATP-dependent RNA helicase HelY [Candidatus Planktophila versatilis]
MTTPAEQYAAAKKRGTHPLTTQFIEQFDFGFDEFQITACQAVEDGKGVLVAAPTGAGKTVVGEFAAFSSLARGRKCFYTTPIKALSNQKFAEFQERFGEHRVGLLTGDTNINSEADILVMTTEVLRNMLYANSSTLTNLGSVVMDEVHYLADKFRGAVWEEVLIHLMESVQVVSLSATVSNAEEFGEWLGEIRGATEVIVSEIRPIPLYQHVLIGDRMIDLFNEPGRINPEILGLEREALRRTKAPRGRRDRFNDSESRLSRAEIIEKLQRENLLPAITFIFSRVGCDAAVKQCLNEGVKLTTTEERIEIVATAQRYTQNLAEEDLEVLGYRDWLTALERGIAAHHAGMLPSFKGAVEDLFKRGLVKAVFATETLALGINMPARTVVLEKLTKWNGEAHVSITPGEYTQLTGRAGRRGIDIEGNAVVQWSPTVDSATAAGLASTRTYPLRSSFTPTYNMSINLIARFGRERARGSLESSFAQFQADRAVIGLVRQIRKNDSAAAEQDESAQCHLGNFSEYARTRIDIKELERLLSKRDGRRTFDQRQRVKMENELDSMRRALRAHPCHSCNDRETHARFAERADRLNRESEGLRSRVENRTHVIAKTFDRICNVLTHLGYIEGEKPLAQGKILAKIYAESDLLLTESIRRGVFENLTPVELLSVASAMIYESRSVENYAPKMPHQNVANALAVVAKIWVELEDIENEFDVKTQREPDFGFCYAAYRWANGHSLSSVIKGTDMTVGDFVRCIKQLIDLLTQIGGAAENLRPICKEGVKRLDRGVVSYMLGEL